MLNQHGEAEIAVSIVLPLQGRHRIFQHLDHRADSSHLLVVVPWRAEPLLGCDSTQAVAERKVDEEVASVMSFQKEHPLVTGFEAEPFTRTNSKRDFGGEPDP